MSESEKKPLKIKRRGDDGYKVVTFRLPEDVVKKLDELARDANRSRNEIVTEIIQYGLENIEIE